MWWVAACSAAHESRRRANGDVGYQVFRALLIKLSELRQ
jgi:hypothetical protein